MDTREESKLIYRFMDYDEWPRLLPLTNRRGFHLPHPQMTTVAVAEQPEGGIAAAWFLQMVMHAEPLIVDPAWEGRVNIERLLRMIDERAQAAKRFVAGYLIQANDERAEHALVEKYGMVEVPGKLLKKEF